MVVVETIHINEISRNSHIAGNWKLSTELRHLDVPVGMNCPAFRSPTSTSSK